MVKINFVAADGSVQQVSGTIGTSIMEAATASNLKGIEADCGGACACATCHVYIDDAWVAKTGTRSSAEEDMLDFAFEVKPNSRLCCQIKITSDLDNIVVKLPRRQF